MENLFSYRSNSLADRLRWLVRIVLGAALSTSLVAAVTSMVRGNAGLEYYLSIYALMYGVLPAGVMVSGLIIYRKIRRQPVWPFIQTEVVLIISTLITIFLPLIVLS